MGNQTALERGERFVSYAQNGEDVVVWRALGHVAGGRYLDVGAADPVVDSFTKALYERGWRGVHVEPVGEYANKLRLDRPEDIVVEAAAGAVKGVTLLYEIPGTGLSTTVDTIAAQHAVVGWASHPRKVPVVTLDSILDDYWPDDTPIHALKIDVEGAEGQVLAGLDLQRHRPWVLIIEATEPLRADAAYQSWEPLVLSSDYVFCLFDGVSRYYVAKEYNDEFAAKLSYPACALDLYTRPEGLAVEALEHSVEELRQSVEELQEETLVWRSEALKHAADAGRLRFDLERLAQAHGSIGLENHLLKEEVAWLRGLVDERDGQIRAMHQTISWKATRPLRFARRIPSRLRARESTR
jgi:FkbM family methyltransferase